jgi:hypothetical protein
MGFRLGLCGAVLPATAILAVTLLAAIHTRLQGILITGAGIALFSGAMLLLPRFNLDRPPRTALRARSPRALKQVFHRLPNFRHNSTTPLGLDCALRESLTSPLRR